MSKKKYVRISFYVPEKFVEDLEWMNDKINMTWSAMLRALICAGCREFRFPEVGHKWNI